MKFSDVKQRLWMGKHKKTRRVIESHEFEPGAKKATSVALQHAEYANNKNYKTSDKIVCRVVPPQLVDIASEIIKLVPLSHSIDMSTRVKQTSKRLGGIRREMNHK